MRTMLQCRGQRQVFMLARNRERRSALARTINGHGGSVKRPDGEYAIKLYHDENNNGKLDTHFFGIPKEAIGFSNNAKPGLGMPAYKKVKFVIQGELVRQVIKVARM